MYFSMYFCFQFNIRVLAFRVCCICFLFLGGQVYAQGDAESNSTAYAQLWNEVNSTTAITKKLSLQLDIQFNSGNDTSKHDFNIVQHFLQYGARGWIHYLATPNFKISAALAMWHNLDVPQSGQYDFNEIRNAFQLTHYYKRKRMVLSNRLRAEQRFIQNESRTSYNFKPRVRYAPKIVYGLNKDEFVSKTLYALLMDEVFLTPMQTNLLAQNKLIVALGYNFTDDVTLEVSYTYQYKFNVDPPNEITNGIGMTLTVNNFFKKRTKTVFEPEP